MTFFERNFLDVFFRYKHLLLLILIFVFSITANYIMEVMIMKNEELKRIYR